MLLNYAKSSCIIFYAKNVLIFLLHTLLTRRFNTFWFKGIDTFWLGVLEQLNIENKKQKVTNIYKESLN